MENEDDFGTTPETAGTLVIGGARSGTIGTDGDVDWLAFDLDAGEIASFAAVEGTGLTLKIVDARGRVVRDAFGFRAFSDEGDRTVFEAPESGTYYLRISGEVGDYAIAAETITDREGDTRDTAEDISIGDTVSASIDSISDLDVFALTVEAGVTYRLTDINSDIPLGLSVLTADGGRSGVTLNAGLPLGESASFTADADGVVFLTFNRTNFIASQNSDPFTGDYSFTITSDTSGDGPNTPTDGADVIFGTQDDDVIDGLAGNDSISGSNGDDVIFGNSGNDELFGGNDNDDLFGGTGADTLRGGAGDDYLDGGAGRDTLFGQGGSDVINGGGGADDLDGGGGHDTLRGQGGNDILFGGGGHDLLLGGNDHDQLNGWSGNDRLFGGNGNDQLVGGEGNDLLNGGSGRDMLFGGSGDDVLKGGSGRDVLDGGTGNDVLVGGGGRDVFAVFANADFTSGHDTVRDYRDGVDRIDLSATDFGNFHELTVVQDGADTVIFIDEDTSLRLQDTDADCLDAGDFIF